MSEPIPPALTPFEWEVLLEADSVDLVISQSRIHDAHKSVAVLLFRHPYGFTLYELQALQSIALINRNKLTEEMNRLGRGPTTDYWHRSLIEADRLEAVIQKIKALLPPESK